MEKAFPDLEKSWKNLEFHEIQSWKNVVELSEICSPPATFWFAVYYKFGRECVAIRDGIKIARECLF